MQSAREPRSLKEIVRIERCGHDTIRQAWVRISERDPLCVGLLIVDFPFHEIARQCPNAGKEVRAKKSRAPSDDRAVAEKLPHDCSGRTAIANRSVPRTAVSDCDLLVVFDLLVVLMAYPISDMPVFEEEDAEAPRNRDV